MKKYVIGIDIGGRSMKFGLFTTFGELIHKSNIETRNEENGKNILPDLREHLIYIIKKFDLSKENLLGIGLGIPGPVLNKSVVRKAANLGWKEQINIKEYLENELGYEVLVENDANVAALGELWQGAGKGYSNLVMITLGTGVGGGIVVDGKIISGTTGSAGEVGHIPFLSKSLSRVCGCGGDKCLEQVCSATGIELLAKEYLQENDLDSTLRNIDNFLAKDIFDEAKAGDKVSLEIVDIYSNHLGRGLAIIGAIVDPSIFVIGGGVSNSGDFLLNNIKKSYKKHAFSVIEDCKFALATLGNDAGVYGAAKLLLS